MGFLHVGLIVVLALLQTVICMECQLGHESTILEKLDFINPKSCPSITDFDSSKQYCCVSDNNRVYCCDAAEFFNNGFGILLPVLVGVAIGLFVVCCVCCFCCPCCLIYKKRHRGTIYGRVQTTVVTVPQPAPQQQAPVYPTQPTTIAMPGYSQQAAYPAYPLQPGLQPPPYSEVPVQEAYSKQAPYNPNFQ